MGDWATYLSSRLSNKETTKERRPFSNIFIRNALFIIIINYKTNFPTKPREAPFQTASPSLNPNPSQPASCCLYPSFLSTDLAILSFHHSATTDNRLKFHSPIRGGVRHAAVCAQDQHFGVAAGVGRGVAEREERPRDDEARLVPRQEVMPRVKG
jgi:hypothetical protein